MCGAEPTRGRVRETGWSPRHDRERAALHDFNNVLSELMATLLLGEDGLVRFHIGELTAMYEEALKHGRA